MCWCVIVTFSMGLNMCPIKWSDSNKPKVNISPVQVLITCDQCWYLFFECKANTGQRSVEGGQTDRRFWQSTNHQLLLLWSWNSSAHHFVLAVRHVNPVFKLFRHNCSTFTSTFGTSSHSSLLHCLCVSVWVTGGGASPGPVWMSVNSTEEKRWGALPHPNPLLQERCKRCQNQFLNPCKRLD